VAGDLNAGMTRMFTSRTQAYSKPQITKNFSSKKRCKDLQIYYMLSAFFLTASRKQL